MNRWFIAIAVFFINFLITGGGRLSTLFFVASLNRYNVGRGSASFPYTLGYCMEFVPGPLIGFLGDKFGIRNVTLCGCIISSVCIGFCFLAEDILTVTILYGLGHGTGSGLSTALLPIILNMYFEKDRTKANGFAMAGSCLGGVVLSPIFQEILEIYGISGSFLIFGALTLNTIPAAILLVVPKAKNQPSSSNLQVYVNPNMDIKDEHNLHNTTEDTMDNTAEDIFHGIAEDTSHNKAEGTLHNTAEGTLHNTAEDTLHNTAEGTSNNIVEDTSGPMYTFTSSHQEEYTRDAFSKNLLSSKWSPKMTKESQKTRDAPVLLDVRNLEQKEVPLKDDKKPEVSNSKKRNSIVESLRIFINPAYLIVMLTHSLYIYIQITLWTVIVDVVRDKGIERQQEVYYVMLLPIADLVGRLSLGWITDSGYLSLMTYLWVTFCLLGISQLLFAWSYGLVTTMVSEIFLSFLIGGIVITFPVVIHEYFSGKNMTMAMTSKGLLLAPLSLIVSPLIGYFRGKLGSYDGLFYLNAAVSFLCCLLTCITPWAARRFNPNFST